VWLSIIITITIFSPFVWVRTVEKYKFGFIFSIFVILIVTVIVIYFTILHINENNGEAGPDWVKFNSENYITMVALGFYTYSNIGALLPIMEACDVK